jgi:6-pyruvoyltetrahydropterin/6-carboxytetrahydropterin synthase
MMSQFRASPKHCPVRFVINYTIIVIAFMMSPSIYVFDQLAVLASLPGEVQSSSISQPKFHLGIRDSFMVAHSFHNHPSFGPAGGLHGATYTCDVDFAANELHPELNWVIDIGDASSILSQVLEQYNYKNLDDIFGSDIMTTTEFLCRQIHSDLCKLLKDKHIPLCPNAEVCVKLWESHRAWASYTAPIL